MLNPPQGLPRLLTVFTRTEIQQIFKNAHTVFKVPELEIRIAPALLTFGRILIIIPRKVGNAPLRNRIRRQLKAIFYEEKLFEAQVDMILLIRQNVHKIPFEVLKGYCVQAVYNSREKAS